MTYFPYFYRCADGYMGQRCEFKDLDGSYLREYIFFIICCTAHTLAYSRADHHLLNPILRTTTCALLESTQIAIP